VSTISWLNESSSACFYEGRGHKEDSPPAALLTKVVGPSEESREGEETKMELAERYIIRHRFWKDLLDRAAKKTDLHANILPGR
jgi:hypothetical protein